MYINKTPQNEQLTAVAKFISTKLNKYEALIGIIFLIGLILKIKTDWNVGILIVLSLNTLAALYFLSAFSVYDDENAGAIEIFIHKLVSYSTSIATIGIMFSIQHWPGSSKLIVVGCITLIVLLPIILNIKSKKPDLIIFNQRLLLRIVLIAALGLLLNFAPKDALIKAGLDKKTI